MNGSAKNSVSGAWAGFVTSVDFSAIEARIFASLIQKGETKLFTKQHYERVAGLLNAQRERIRVDTQLDDYQRSAQMNALNDVVIGFVQLFRKDRPDRFRELQFIGECDRAAAQPAKPKA